MNRIPTLWLALAMGVLAEAVFLGLAIPSAKIGPCGPANGFGAALLVVHLPGLWIAKNLLPQNNLLELPVTIGATASLWGVIAFFIMSLVRGFCDKTSEGGD